MTKYRKTDLPAVLGRSRSTVDRYLVRGSLPEAIERVGHSALWDSAELDQWFGKLNDQIACVVSVDNALGLRELSEENVYVCPTDSGGNIGLERPSLLGFFEKGGGGTVTFYDVTAVETIGAGPRGTKPARKKAKRILKARKRAGFEQSGNLAIFRLAELPAGSLRLAEVVQNARVTSPAWVRENYGKEGLFLPPTDRIRFS